MSGSTAWETAYCDFFLARRRPLMRTAYAILGSWPAAEDATQTTMTQLYVHWPRIQSEAVDAYARRTLVNTCFRMASRGGREVAVEGVPDRMSYDGEAPIDRVDLMTALAGLSTRDRAVIALRFLDDLPVAEVAIILDLPEGTVKSQTSRALDRLEAVLTEPSTHDDARRIP